MNRKETQIERARKFNAENYEKITFRVPKGMHGRIKAAAEAAKLSTNAYILAAVKKVLPPKKETE